MFSDLVAPSVYNQLHCLNVIQIAPIVPKDPNCRKWV